MYSKELAELIKDLNLDKSHWINAEVLKFKKSNNYENLKIKIKHIPKELTDFTIKCHCGCEFKPNWLKKRPPTSVMLSKDIGLVNHATYLIECSACNSLVTLTPPEVKYIRDIEIYGDEALRVVDKKTIFVYSFVSFSGSSKRKNEFEKKYYELKKCLSPNAHPKSWVLHMTEILSGSKREKNIDISHLSSVDALKGIKRIIDLISEYNTSMDLNSYSSVSIAIGDKTKKHEKLMFVEEVYSAALMNVIQETTESGHVPKFYFERTGTDGWATNLFEGARCTLLWHWISNGLAVKSPKFVKPSYSFYLEIADILSFVIARHLFCTGSRVEGKDSKPQISPSSLGFVRYILTDQRGNWRRENMIGFPDEAMFRGTSWEKFIRGHGS